MLCHLLRPDLAGGPRGPEAGLAVVPGEGRGRAELGPGGEAGGGGGRPGAARPAQAAPGRAGHCRGPWYDNNMSILIFLC